MKDVAINKLSIQQDTNRGHHVACAFVATWSLRTGAMVDSVRGGVGSSG